LAAHCEKLDIGPLRKIQSFPDPVNKAVKRRLECVAGEGPKLSEFAREGTANSNLLGRDGERKGAAEWDWGF
jgi:hypothetical protein